MARFKGKDLYLKDDDQIYFGDGQDAALWYDDSELRLDHTISGTAATQGYHLILKDQVDFEITTLSGMLIDDHSKLLNLDYNSAGHLGFLSTGTVQTISGTKTFDGYSDLKLISENTYKSRLKFVRANDNLLTEMYNVPWGVVGNMGTFIKDYTGEIHLDANGGSGKIFLNGTVNFPSDRKLGFGLQGSFGPFFEMFYKSSDKSVHFDPKPALFPGSEPDFIVFNENGYDTDIRMEGDTDPNLFFLDAGNDTITIGGNSSIGKFNVEGASYLGGLTTINGNFVPATDDTYSLGSSFPARYFKYLHVETIHGNPNDNLYLSTSNNRQIRLYSDRDIINMLGDHAGVNYWHIENDVDGVQVRIYSDGKAIFGAENPYESEQFRFIGDMRIEGNTTISGGNLYYGSNTISGTGDIYCDSIYTSGSSIHVDSSVISSIGTGINLVLGDGKVEFDGDVHAVYYYGAGSYLNGIPRDFVDLNDTPNSYDEDKYLVATASGLEWTTVSGATGPPGPQGDPGPQGPVGEDGGEWLCGHGVPTTATGSLNNFYLDLDTGDIYRKETTVTGTYNVVIEREADYSYTFADAIRFVKSGREVIVDDADDEASFTGYWYSFSNASAWEGGCKYATSSYGAQGIFKFKEVPEDGVYDIYAWWPIYSNSGRNVPFTITHVSGTTTVRKDQHTGTPQWNYLSTHEFDGAPVWVWKMNIHGDDRPTTFSGLTDTPNYYDAGKYLRSTSSGIEFADLDLDDYYTKTEVDTISGSLQSDIDNHVNDSTIHFTESSIDHTNLQNIGSNTHVQIDTHIADASIHLSAHIIQCYTTLTTNLNVTTPVALGWDTEDFKDNLYTHSNITNNSRIEVEKDGIYKITYQINTDNASNNRNTIRTRIRVNGSTYINRGTAYSYSRNATDDKQSNGCGFLWLLDANDYIELMGDRQGSSGAGNNIANQSHICLELVRYV